ncbi:MAG: Mur ligase family protein, partial [Anaerolineae bacterium]
MSFAGLKVVVVGLAREGSAAARFLAEQGAAVTVTDAQPARKLAGRVAALQSLGITFCLGRHPVTLLNPSHTDLLVVSPGVPPGIPFLRQAKGRGLPLTTESRLFCRLCPAPIVGISGSSGKTTTTTLVGNMLRAAGFTTHVGGNIGQPLIGRLAEISPQDRVVMELSSFQLEYFHGSFNRGARFPPRFEWLDRGWSP